MAELPASFGKYFLCDKIAEGGMAEIYLAKLFGPGGFEKQLVLKQISRELGKERQFVELFVAEAKTLVSLSHGNIVPVYELGVVDDTYFIAMEYVDGPTLGELMAALARSGERLEPAVAAHIAAELCKGLDYAHRKGEGVIHRDLSPRNVLLSRDGEVKLVDFGLALAGDRAQHAHRGSSLPAGSFPYMSPEQVRGEPLDPRSDLFSLGVLLWEMLAGAHLFARADADATLAAVLDQPIRPPSQTRPDLPAELDRTCLRALARSRDERYASAGEILAALARFAYSVEPPVTQATLASLVARACPPVARAAGTRASPASAPPAGADLDQTRPLGRPASAAQPGMVRTFATSEQFDQVLANATPLLPFPALVDVQTRPLSVRRAPSPAPAPRRAPRRAIALAAAAAAAGLVAAVAARGDDSGPSEPPRAEARSRAEAEASPGAAPTRVAAAAAAPMPAGPATALAAGRAAAPGPVPGVPPASAGAEAGPAAPSRSSPAARPTPPDRPGTEAGAAKDRRPRGQGTLQVGANPWADVYVDGALLGQAPGSWPIPAGPHSVELRYRDARRRFRVAVEAGHTESLGLVDFTAAP
jgi:serine/threonine-protein kinase